MSPVIGAQDALYVEYLSKKIIAASAVIDVIIVALVEHRAMYFLPH